MQRGEVDLCIVGTDRTTRSGDVCNKIGTYLKALAAHDNGVPFYVAVPSPSIDWTIDDGARRSRSRSAAATRSRVTAAAQRRRCARSGRQRGRESRRSTSRRARLVTGLITERGIADRRARRCARCSRSTRDDACASATSSSRRRKQMSELGLTPGHVGQRQRAQPATACSSRRRACRTPSSSPTTSSSSTHDGSAAPRPAHAVDRVAPPPRHPRRAPGRPRDRPHALAVLHDDRRCLRRPIPAIHYMVVLAGSDEIPCAEYATFGSARARAQCGDARSRGGDACLLANHGMIALGTIARDARCGSPPRSRRSPRSTGTPRSSARRTSSMRDELARVRERFAEYGQQRPRARRSW